MGDRKRHLFFYLLFLGGGCLALSLFLSGRSSADTILLKDGKELKGLIVEKHVDRVILSTEKGEVPVLLKNVKDIRYDDQEQSMMQIAASFEKEGKFGQALAYYDKALELNPNLSEARRAATGLRNRFVAIQSEGPREEVEKQQMIFEAWDKGKGVGDIIKEKQVEQAKALRTGLGVSLEKKGDWVRFSYVDPKLPAGISGLKKNDRLVSMDGQSLRYQAVDVVTKNMLVPRYSNFTLEFEKDIFVPVEEGSRISLQTLGLKLKLEYEGLKAESVKKGSRAETAGLKKKDFVVGINGEMTRYLSLKQAAKIIEGPQEEDRILIAVRRAAILTRK
ncbi:MAG: PDZ domain-containing protein [Candidatus Omnitrophota bacterium]